MANHTGGAPREEVPLHDRLRLVRTWTVIGGILIFIAVLVALGYLGPVIEFLGVGVIVGFVCSPVVNWLERHGVGRALGSIVALVLVLGVVLGLFAVLGPLFTEQLLNLLERVPGFLREGEEWVKEFFARYGTQETAELQLNVTGLLDSFSAMGSRLATDLAGALSSGLIPNIMSLANSFFMFFLGLVMAYWLACDYPVIVREFAVIAGPRHRDDLTLMLAVASRSMGGYMRSIVITSAVAGVLAFIAFLIVGQPYAPLMGILTGILHFIPVVGPFLSASTATLTALLVSPVCAFWTCVGSMIAANITDNIVSPIVNRSTVQVHPALSLLAIVVGSTLGGAIGMAISIPISAAIKGVFIYYFETKTGRQVVSYDGALFQGTPFRHADGTPAPSFDALDDDHFYDTSKLVPEQGPDDVEAGQRPVAAEHRMVETLRKRAEEAKTVVEGALRRDDKDVRATRAEERRADAPMDEQIVVDAEREGVRKDGPVSPGPADKGIAQLDHVGGLASPGDGTDSPAQGTDGPAQGTDGPAQDTDPSHLH